ncbi:MAG: hypothetical protein AAFQ43_05125 [Bacteroidota bacterium]
MRSFALLAALALLAVPTLTGCDEVAPVSADDLVTDARIARQAGDVDQAVDLLERAFAADAADAVVRVELASALFEQSDLGIADLDALASYLLDEANSGGVAPFTPEASKGGSCPYESEPGAVPFDPRDLDEYGQYLERVSVARRVREILDPVITEELRPDDFLCTGIQDGELNYDPDAALAALRAQDEDLSDTQIASALGANAVAEVIDTYVFLSEDLRDDAAWYRLSDGTLGVCPVGITEEDLRARAEPSVADLGEALLSIDLRGRLVETSATELVDVVIDAYEEVRDDLAPNCSN